MAEPIVLAIDLGTTYTAATWVGPGGRPEPVRLGNRSHQMPTAVHPDESGDVLVGEAAERRGAQDPSRLAREFKLQVGDPTPVLLHGTPLTIETLICHVLRHVLREARAAIGRDPDRVVLTHPVAWGEYKLDVLRGGARMAGIAEPLLVPEPVAAAIWYASAERIPVGARVAVYDLGGGTFDAAVLERTTGGFELRGNPEGLDRMGGTAFDHAVLAQVMDTIRAEVAELDVDDPAVRSALARLRRECVEAKEALSADTIATVTVALPGLHRQVRVTRADLESRIRPSLTETMHALERALESSGTSPDQLAGVLLIGGSSRIPLVCELVGARIGRPVAIDADPKLSVALGAAQAGAFVSAPAVAPQPPLPSPARPVLPAGTGVAPQHHDPPAQQHPSQQPGVPHHQGPPAAPSPSPRRSRGPRPLWLVVLAAVLVVGIVAFVVGQRFSGGFGQVQAVAVDGGGCAISWAASDWSAGDRVQLLRDGATVHWAETATGQWSSPGSVTDVVHWRGSEQIGSAAISGC